MVARASTPLSRPYPVPSVDSTSFKQALANLAAGVSVITTRAADGEKIGLTATAVTALSADPPLVLACLGGWARALAPLQAGAPFIIHLLAAEQQALARHFATPQADKFAGVPHVAGPGGIPRLTDALAWIECLPERLIPAGDHQIVVGRVIGLRGGDERAPLVYFRRDFHSLRRAIGPGEASPAA